MNRILLAATLVALFLKPALAADPAPAPQLTPRDAAEVLQLIQSATVPVNAMNEVARLETLLNSIANPPKK